MTFVFPPVAKHKNSAYAHHFYRRVPTKMLVASWRAYSGMH